MSIRNFVRYRIWPWSRINQLKYDIDWSNRQVEDLVKAIKHWHKTGEVDELNAIAGGIWLEYYYRLLKIRSKPSHHRLLTNITLEEDTHKEVA